MGSGWQHSVTRRALVAFAVIVCLLLFGPWRLLADLLDPMLVSIGVRLVLLAVPLAAMAGLGAGRVVVPARRGFRQAMHWAGYLAVVSVAISVFDLAGMLTGAAGGAWASQYGWLESVLLSLLLCLVVGALEEFLFRGLLLGGLMARWGGTRRGIVGSVLVSALVFGLLHVAVDILAGPYTVATVLQMLLKTVQTAIFGVLAAAAFVRARNLWGVAVAHAAADFLPVALQTLSGIPQEAGYVTADDSQLPVILLAYGVILVLYVPAMARSARLLRGATAPDYGPFSPR